MWRRVIQTWEDRAMLVLRLALGVVMFAHGAQKGLGWFGGEGLAATVTGMEQQGLPVPVALLVVAAELLGSLGLILGLLGRLAAAGIGLVMLGAIFLVHLPNGLFMNWTGQQPGEGFEYHVLALAMVVAVMVRGSGALSVDLALSRSADATPPLDARARLSRVKGQRAA